MNGNNIDKVLEIVNAIHNTNFRLLSKCEGGEDGAYSIAAPEKKAVIFKFFQDYRDSNIMDVDPTMAMKITDKLLTLDYPVSRYLLSGRFGEYGLYWIQEKLPGYALTKAPSPELLTKLLNLLKKQKGQAISKQQNWSNYVKQVVFNNRRGWMDILKDYSVETTKLWLEIRKFIDGLSTIELPDNDIVHGDISYQQMMVNGDELQGIIDWQEAGCGDLGIDMSRVLYRLHDRSHLVPIILKNLESFDPKAIQLYTVYSATEFVAWRIDRNPDLKASVDKALSALSFVRDNFK